MFRIETGGCEIETQIGHVVEAFNRVFLCPFSLRDAYVFPAPCPNFPSTSSPRALVDRPVERLPFCKVRGRVGGPLETGVLSDGTHPVFKTRDLRRRGSCAPTGFPRASRRPGPRRERPQ